MANNFQPVPETVFGYLPRSPYLDDALEHARQLSNCNPPSKRRSVGNIDHYSGHQMLQHASNNPSLSQDLDETIRRFVVSKKTGLVGVDGCEIGPILPFSLPIVRSVILPDMQRYNQRCVVMAIFPSTSERREPLTSFEASIVSALMRAFILWLKAFQL